MKQHLAMLWQANGEAWRLYRALCSPTIGECDLYGYVLERWTAAWPIEDVLDLLKRLDVIREVLEPKK